MGLAPVGEWDDVKEMSSPISASLWLLLPLYDVSAGRVASAIVSLLASDLLLGGSALPCTGVLASSRLSSKSG